MAPELVQKMPYDSGVDIWALGVIAHKILAGNEPFSGKSKEKIFNAILNEVPSYVLFLKYK